MAFGGTGGNDTYTGTSGPENIYGGDGNDTLDGAGGNDYIEGGQGNDSLIGGTGNDTVGYFQALQGVSVNLQTGVATGAGTDTISGFEVVTGSNFGDTIFGDAGANVVHAVGGDDFIDGAGGNDFLIGGAGNDSALGAAGDDQLYGGDGDDTLDGGAGNDILFYFQDAGAVVVDLANGTATDGAGGHDTVSGFEIVYGSPFADSITGSSNADSLRGWDGDDTLRGGPGNDTLVGGNGNDTAEFSGSVSQYTFSWLSATDLQVSGPDGVDTLTGIEHLHFDAGNVTIDIGAVGTSAPDTLTGGSGSDLIRAGGGNDHVTGGGGDDLLFGDAGADDLQGDEGNDLLDGGADNDTMRGGTGNDNYIVDSEGDVTMEPDTVSQLPAGAAGQVNVGNGIDTITSSLDRTLPSGFENLFLQADTNARVGVGNALPNVLTGNAGANTLSGLAGNDTIDGGAGIDTGGYSSGRAQYTVTHGDTGWQVSGGGEGSDTLTNIERLQFADGHLALDLDGNAGEVARILGAVFGPAFVHDAAFVAIGLQYADTGMTYDALMQLALGVRLGSNAGNADVVTLLYTNVIGQAPDAATRDMFVSWIAGGSHTQASLGVLAAETDFNAQRIGLGELAAHGLAYL